MDNAIPILSLIVAALAVFVGPFISWFVAKSQLASSLEIANKQIIAPMRQGLDQRLEEPPLGAYEQRSALPRRGL